MVDSGTKAFLGHDHKMCSLIQAAGSYVGSLTACLLPCTVDSAAGMGWQSQNLGGWLACRRSVLALLSTAESHPLLPYRCISGKSLLLAKELPCALHQCAQAISLLHNSSIATDRADKVLCVMINFGKKVLAASRPTFLAVFWALRFMFSPDLTSCSYPAPVLFEFCSTPSCIYSHWRKTSIQHISKPPAEAMRKHGGDALAWRLVLAALASVHVQVLLRAAAVEGQW